MVDLGDRACVDRTHTDPAAKTRLDRGNARRSVWTRRVWSRRCVGNTAGAACKHQPCPASNDRPARLHLEAERLALGSEEFVRAENGQIDERVELVARKGALFARALDLDQLAARRHDEVGIDLRG